MKLKIGILIGEFENLLNWELRIIESILLDDTLELSLLIRDGRKSKKNPLSLKNKFKLLFKSQYFFATIIFYLQKIIERKLFKITPTVDKDYIINRLESIEAVYLHPKQKGFLDVFNESDSKKIQSYKLDIILRHHFNIIRGGILKSSRYGIWSFHHADNSINRGSPAAFWEILLNQPSVGVTLQQLTPDLDGGLVIDKAFYNTHWSLQKLNNIILEGSVSILIKNIRKLQINKYSVKSSSVYYNPLYKHPDFYNTFKYVIKFYSKLLSLTLKKINTKVFGIRYDCWTLFIGKGDFLSSTLFKLKPVKMPKNEFWADPFIYKYKNENYIFFENYSYKSKLGKISCGKIKGNQLIEITDVLDLDYHLSFPFIYEEDGNIFLIPETNANNRLEVYICLAFPNKWKLYSTAFEGEKVVDSHIFKDHNNQKWLFVNKKANINCPGVAELYIYKFDDLNFNNLQSHKENPVIISSKSARNAGSIFSYKNEVFRPSQAHIEGIYGRALNINKIEKLTIDDYIEKNITTIYPNFKEGLISMHHLHQYDNLFVIDAAYKKRF